LGVRNALGAWLVHVPGSIRNALIALFFLFILRALLRNQLLAGAAYVLFFTLINYLGDTHPVMNALEGMLINSTIAVAIVRLGVLPVAVGEVVYGLIQAIPVTANPSAWYFGNATLMPAGALALAVWDFSRPLRD